MNTLDIIKSEIDKIVFEKYPDISRDFKFEVSFIDENNSSFGDISTNIVLILTKELSKNTKEIGDDLISEINIHIKDKKQLSGIVKSISLAPNGFINFFLKEDFLISDLKRVSDLEFIETKFTNKKVLIEHSSPNLFKPFHIGHLMNNIIGESVVNMMKATKSDLKKVSFPSDISIGIAKAIYILKTKKDWSFEDNDIIEKLGNSYVEGVKFYDENEDRREEVINIVKNLFEKNIETEDYQIFEKAKEVNINYFKSVLEKLGTKFDHLIYESEAGIRGEIIIKENLNLDKEKEVFEIGDRGAVVFDTKRKRNNESEETIKSVFINSEGHPTYEAKDLGLLDLKYGYFPFDYNFFVTDSEQSPHFEVVLQAAKLLGEKYNDNTWDIISKNSIHIPHGRLNLKGERMSSRLGNILGVDETLKLVGDKVIQKIGEKYNDLGEESMDDLIKKISLASLRIAILKSKPGLNIDFDFDTSISFEGATGPYILYTYARANSILEKVDYISDVEEIKDLSKNHLILIKKLIEFESVAKRAVEDIAPQIIVKYLFDLTSSFNAFYAKEKIISDDSQKTAENIFIVKRFMKVLKFAMNMIGIEEVEKM